MKSQVANQKLQVHKNHRKFISFVVSSFLLISLMWGIGWPSYSWAKSIWELRGQTQESSQGETAAPAREEEKTLPEIVPTSKEPNPEIKKLVEAIEIPTQYGRVKERYVGTAPVVIFAMQEIHNHPEVQKNNKEIMEILLDQYGTQLILIEGHHGPLLVPSLRAMSKSLREELAKSKIESGYYAAEEYLNLTREVPPVIIGVESEKIIKEKQDLVYFKFVIENRPRAEAHFASLKQAIESAKAKLYNIELKAFDVSAQEYLEDKITAEEYISILDQLLKDYGRSVSETSYPNVSLVLKAQETEEQEKFEESQTYLQKVDHSQLFGEIKQVEELAREQLYKSPQERELTHLAKGFYYLGKIKEISLIPLEWEEYIQEISHSFTVSGLVSFLRQNGMDTSLPTAEEVVFLDQYRKEGENLYQSAIDRERTMIENSLATLRDKGETKAILKTGGFHTAAISQFLRTNDISYVVIAPRVTQPNLPTPYWDLMKKSFENLKGSAQGLSR